MSERIDGIVERAVRETDGRTALWTRLVADLGCTALCEIGVWKGEFAQTMLESVDGIESYTLVDPWRNLPDWNKPANKSDIEFEDIRSEAMRRVAPFADKIAEIRDTTKNARTQIADGSLDFVYIDGDHTLRGITIDMLSIYSKIRPGGFIGGDDFTKSIWQHGQGFSPTEVFPFAVYFAEAHDLKIYTLPYSQFLIVCDPSGFCVRDHGGYSELTPAQIYTESSGDKLRRLARKLPPGVRDGLKKVFGRTR